MRCLTDLHEAVVPDGFMFEVFLVNDASTDGTSERVKTAFPDVNLVQGDGNLYWNRGMIKAWETAATNGDWDYYLWLNDDTYLFPSAFSELLEISYQFHDESIVCGSTISNETGELTYGGRFENGQLITPEDTSRVCYYINGNCVLVPKFVFSRVGMLDAFFTHALGDFDYGFRAKKIGISTVATKVPIGSCERNELPPVWCRDNISFFERLRNLYSPLASSHPVKFFVFRLRYFGCRKALINLFSIHFRLLFPGMNRKWGKLQ